ncbi:DUF4920 domain-containing protein [Aquimarina sp. 2201CG14-23]|uniref:DUF4920 domain-containing protein n=1 Tax=Aquimarina mycalae TaxID=3040073 RepID=UPI0024780B60|nr:DUF4920 domain-containing protein [Aquimarina sp. 2201CG14-23]MDH7444474.1 DUF4920 domain-containing protein [Aquimarina sp. 2201CG14-23]
MKKIALLFAGLSCLIACNSTQKEEESFSVKDVAIQEYNNFGGAVSSDKIYYKNVIAEKYQNLEEGDTIDIAFASTVNDVCKAKGCWMKVALDNGQETMVKFKDYGFFVPKDIEKDSVIVQGKAYVSETSVEELRHLASDAGKTEAEIAAITTPKKTFSFMAEGVLVKQ